MANLLTGKVVVVTGAGGGIGRDFAHAMAAQGAKVVVNDVGASVSGEGQDAGPAQTVVEEIKAAGGTAVANTDSVADWDAANRIIKTAIDAFGQIDCVVNNASTAELIDIAQMSRSGVTGTADSVAAIVSRPATTQCIAAAARTA